MQNFKNKGAVITGGASGFGREFAHIGARLGSTSISSPIPRRWATSRSAWRPSSISATPATPTKLRRIFVRCCRKS